jgi:hypothetical protein
VLLGHGPNKAFPLPVSFRVTEGNDYSIKADVTDDTMEND